MYGGRLAGRAAEDMEEKMRRLHLGMLAACAAVFALPVLAESRQAVCGRRAALLQRRHRGAKHGAWSACRA